MINRPLLLITLDVPLDNINSILESTEYGNEGMPKLSIERKENNWLVRGEWTEAQAEILFKSFNRHGLHYTEHRKP